MDPISVACVGISMTTTGLCVKQSWGRMRPKREVLNQSRIAELEAQVFSIPVPKTFPEWQRWSETNRQSQFTWFNMPIILRDPELQEAHEAAERAAYNARWSMDKYLEYLEYVEYHPDPPADTPRLRLLPQLSEKTETSSNRRRA